MVDQQDGERAKGHSFLIENILSRDDRPKQDEPTKQNCIAFPTRSTHHSTGVNDDIQDICGCSEDNTNSSSECHPQIRHKKKTRTVFSRHQIFYLESAFEMKRYLSSTERSEMARTLKLSETQVKVWFQNRRNKWKSQINGQDSYSPETPLYPPPFSPFAVDPRLQQRLTMLHPMSPLFY